MNQEKQKVIQKEPQKVYGAEFKEYSVKLAIGLDQQTVETAMDLGINPSA